MFNFLLYLYFLLNSFLLFLNADAFELFRTEASFYSVKVQSSNGNTAFNDSFFIIDKDYLSDEDVEVTHLSGDIPLSDYSLGCPFPEELSEIQLQFNSQYFYRNIKYYLLYCCFKIPSI